MDQAVADRIRDAIVGGVFQPGERLTEINLANKLAVSRSTVRAGLQRLLAEGLVSLQPYSGWHVLSLNSRDAWELFTLRSCLEALASRLAAENIDENGSAALKDSFGRLRAAVQSVDDKAIADADLGLHALIVSMARHSRLSAHYELVKQQIRLYIASSNAMLQSRKQIISNHRELVEAICSGDGRKAARLAREHGAGAAEELFETLRDAQKATEPENIQRGSKSPPQRMSRHAAKRMARTRRRA